MARVSGAHRPSFRRNAGLASLACAAGAIALLFDVIEPHAQSTAPPGQPGAAAPGSSAGAYFESAGSIAEQLLKTPVGTISPGDIPASPEVKSPVGDSSAAIERGMRYFEAFNCVGCHAPNGGGGMGLALSNGAFLYGSEPANIYLTISQGRPRGMPAWGSMLPQNVIWDLVAYVRSISKEPTKEWGKTVSAQMPQIEQVPAEFVSTSSPWGQTQSFSHGQKPTKAR